MSTPTNTCIFSGLPVCFDPVEGAGQYCRKHAHQTISHPEPTQQAPAVVAETPKTKSPSVSLSLHGDLKLQEDELRSVAREWALGQSPYDILRIAGVLECVFKERRDTIIRAAVAKRLSLEGIKMLEIVEEEDPNNKGSGRTVK